MEMEKEVKKNFIVGDEWLYYKIYTGYKTSDLILIELIKPLVKSLKTKKIISKWFFIRYADPEYHLRLRFNFKNQEHLLLIINELNSHFRESIDNGLIWKIQLETYERELERYGKYAIDLAEKIFFNDSTMILDLVSIVDEKDSEELRWLIVLKTMDDYFTLFEFDREKRLEFVRNIKNGFGNYYKNDFVSLTSQLNIKYRDKNKIIKLFLEKNTYEGVVQEDMMELLEINLKENKSAIQELLLLDRNGTLGVNLYELLSSYIHMRLNRLFKSRNNLNEYICYDFLYRYYMSIK